MNPKPVFRVDVPTVRDGSKLPRFPIGRRPHPARSPRAPLHPPGGRFHHRNRGGTNRRASETGDRVPEQRSSDSGPVSRMHVAPDYLHSQGTAGRAESADENGEKSGLRNRKSMKNNFTENWSRLFSFCFVL